MKVIHEAMKVVEDPSKTFELSRFVVKTRALVEWRCLLLLVSYCREIPVAMKMSVF